ncbi:MAG: carbohydrate ABC transporter permease [Caldilinea sp.]|nr:carbohydrate ABC transporter permease [Caldilinea sp.]MCB0059475.1 carbohydrate ABC transporter permease [Caldilineaceae bacterium]MCB0066201.1 carbohydrate ABC transporter permease [Caldilineaceae bacterium]MCB9115064.1 carbohydrate ABC transporter permease [Caldilineaceae bacterium]MCO5209652.1 carbohydrate ABC transporter permease [Caldilinea sp.]
MAAQSTTSPRRTRPHRTRRVLGNLLYALVLLLVLFFLLTPFLWMVLNAFKSPLQIIKLPPELIFEPTLRNFQNVFGTQNFGRYIMNSVIIGAGCTLVGLLIGLPAAYSIARYRQNRLAIVILMARMVPGITFLVPLFIIFRRLELIDTYTSLILAHMLVGLPFIVWVMVPFFESIPRELTEAAVVDGASSVRAFVSVVLPLSGPGIVTASILSFVFSWNNFMFSIVLASSRTRTVPVAIYNFISYAQIDWGGLMAAAVVITLPVLVLAIITQRYVIRGLTAGAIKG